MADPKEAKRRATYQDVLNAPEHMVAEILDGELFLSPRPGKPHCSVYTTLVGDLEPPFGRGRGGPGGWIILGEPELHLGDDVCVPDIAGWRRDRMPRLDDDQAYFETPPDWVCEVLSKSTERNDRLKKLRIYARAGVVNAWLVSPRMRSLEVFRLIDGRLVTVATHLDDEKVHAEPFDAIEIELASLWRDFKPPIHAAEGAADYDYL
ncbi:MAG: Uma2 family endonuclease [Deltaproteobacteria bacterium]|nr:Uma2 family endonuclease [Deltaproteobacteria bacterium]MDQ3299349.1 Uma2 family endonuclease [Myxococcota bacterium]